jgi:ABC-2 type transport system ATP-binding protein
VSLKIEHVTKRYGNFTAVDDLNLEISPSRIFGLLGANGAGKTTTIRMILGILSPTEGKITWNGKEINYDMSNHIGYLPEERGLYPKLTVKDQLIYLGRLRGMGKGQILTELKKWLEKFHVPEYLDKKVEELSKGNQQKIQFIASVIHKPSLLFLDEPFSGLDPVNVELLKNAVIDVAKEGTTIIFSSHRMDQVEEFCEHLCILHKGRPVVHGSLREIKRQFGKKNIEIHTEANLDFLQDKNGVTKLKKTAQGYKVQIAEDEVSQRILKEIADKGFITKFALEEPSLHDIFVEKVGASYE